MTRCCMRLGGGGSRAQCNMPSKQLPRVPGALAPHAALSAPPARPSPRPRSIGFSVRDAQGGWQQVPICYPMRCAGLWAVSVLGRPVQSGGQPGRFASHLVLWWLCPTCSATDLPAFQHCECCGWLQVDESGAPTDVLTLVSHGSVVLSCRGPQLSFDLEWCLNVSSEDGCSAVCSRETQNGGVHCSAGRSSPVHLPRLALLLPRRRLHRLAALCCSQARVGQRPGLPGGAPAATRGRRGSSGWHCGSAAMAASACAPYHRSYLHRRCGSSAGRASVWR